MWELEERLFLYSGALYITYFGHAKKFAPPKISDGFNFRKKKLMETLQKSNLI